METTQAVARMCSIKKVFRDILQISQENTCARVFFLMKLQANTFSHRTPPVAVSETRLMKQFIRNSGEFISMCKN